MSVQTGKVLGAVVETIEDGSFGGTTGNYLKIVSETAPGLEVREKLLIDLLVTGQGKDRLAGKPIIIR
jgi:hypothetical protein